MAGHAVQRPAGARIIGVLRSAGVFLFAAFIALCGLVTPFLQDEQLTSHPGFGIAFSTTVIVAGWIGLGAGPIGRALRARCAASPRMTRFLSTEAAYLGWDFEIGTFLRLAGWPLLLGLGIGAAYARVLSL